MSEPYLHLYAQACEHDEAMISGNRESLIQLRDAIDEAIKTEHNGIFRNPKTIMGMDTKSDFFTKDGEGYTVLIRCVEDDGEFDKYSLPYTDYL
jgi:hypothetical protein